MRQHLNAIQPRLIHEWPIIFALDAKFIILRILEGIEGFVGVTNEGQTHFGILLRSVLSGLCTVDRTCVFLRNLIDREIADVDV